MSLLKYKSNWTAWRKFLQYILLFFSDAFSELVASGELEASSSLQFMTADSLNDVVRKLCFHGHFTGSSVIIVLVKFIDDIVSFSCWPAGSVRIALLANHSGAAYLRSR